MSVKNTIKQVTPATVWEAASDLRYAVQRAALWPAATFHPLRRASIRKLGEYKDIHRNQRCFIIGNGPSLKQTDLSCLRHEFTIGMNRFYPSFSDLGFPTTYYLCVNSLVIEQCAEEICALPVPKFLSWRSHALINPHLKPVGKESRMDRPAYGNEAIFLHTTYTGPRFSRDLRGRLWEGATVTYVALQIAFYMGFQQVILIGVDHNFSTQGKPNTTITSQGDDPDHFHASYFGAGFRWQLPDLATSERAYRMAGQAYEQAGRQVLDATVGGKLDVFPKVSYSSLFPGAQL